MPRRKRKRSPTLVVGLCKIGTLAHNRAFTTREYTEYTGRSSSEIRLFKRHGLIKTVEGRKLYPTSRGWKAIDRICRGKR